MGGKEVCAVHGGRRGGGAAHDDGVAQDQEELWRGRGCIGRGDVKKQNNHCELIN